MAQDFATPVARGAFPNSSYRWFFPYSGYRDTSGKGLYAPSTVMSIGGGVMDWYLHTLNGTPQVSSVVPEVPSTGWGQLYGRYSVRFRSDVMPGYKLAFMLWPDDDNWKEGEVDFPEAGGLTTSDYIYANRYAAGRPVLTSGTTGFKTSVAPAGTGWHTATIEWSPNNLTYYLDGAKLGTTTSGIPTTKMHLVLQVETAVTGPAPAASVAGHLQVDWVTMYKRS